MIGNDLITDAEGYLEWDDHFERKHIVCAPHPPKESPVAMMGVAFDTLSLLGTLARIEEMISQRTPRYIVTPNVDFLVQARQDAELRRVLLDAHLVLCDGTPLVWASQLLGRRLPERVAGSDLVPQLIRVAAERKHRLFFLGATPEANSQAVANVRTQYPNVNIAGTCSPPFGPLEKMDHEEIRKKIQAARPDILLVAFGCPKAEKWMARHHQSLGVPVMIGVGGTIDFLAGRVKRAPLWMQRGGVEWLYRMCQEPRRLFRRYLTDFWHFIPAISEQFWRMKGRLASRALPSEPFRVSVLQPTWLRLQAPARLHASAARLDEGVWDDMDDRHCLLDLDEVKSIDSTGIGFLLQLRKSIQAAGRCLVLLAPSPVVQRALKTTRAQEFFLTAANAMEARRLIKEQTNGHETLQLPNLPAGLLGGAA
jgi:N-acetylglucosaminyldiphosphoundecaprenol N-acetyl-beta-D-mannosaminyltransferase